jgi:HrpA-like RNA helicase
MADVKDDLLAKVRDNEVVVVGGETGCGKTTQVCSFLPHKLRYDGSVLCEADGRACGTGATIHIR